MNRNDEENIDLVQCPHNNVINEGGNLICRDCGLILEEMINFDENSALIDMFDESQKSYERRIRIRDLKSIQDPKVKEKYDRIQKLEKWFRDYKLSFSDQKKTLDLLKSYDIGLNIDNVKFREIKERYMKYNRRHRKIYQNMVIIFLAIVWMEIKDTTNVRIEEFIDACNDLGHKINKKMVNNAMLKVLKSENKWQEKEDIQTGDLEEKIKDKIKILFQKNLNDIPFNAVKDVLHNKSQFNKLKIDMLLILDKILKNIPYYNIKNLNYKAFTAGLIYYIGQLMNNDTKKIFIQNLVEKVTNFSSTTIRKKYHMLIKLIGNPEKINYQIKS